MFLKQFKVQLNQVVVQLEVSKTHVNVQLKPDSWFNSRSGRGLAPALRFNSCHHLFKDLINRQSS